MSVIIKNTKGTVFEGCDFVVQLPNTRRNDAKILQITDMQVIDSSQRRQPDRIRPDEIAAWDPENFDAQCGNHIRSLIAQSTPDLIIITGDIVYGSFDDSGETLRWMCSLMDSFEIPWAPVFGNHDNESKKGVAWQCEQFENSKYCLFKRGNVSGNGNYTVGVAVGNELIRTIHMLDSNGCKDGDDPSIIKTPGIYNDQLSMISDNTAKILNSQGRMIPSFLAFHIPTEHFLEAERAKGYACENTDYYAIGVTTPAKDGDFGFRYKIHSDIFKTGVDFIDFLKNQGVGGVFVGHVHGACTRILYQDIVWVYGLKTGQYDSHIPYGLGGTEITLIGDRFNIRHIPSLVQPAPMPEKAPMFKDFFAKSDC